MKLINDTAKHNNIDPETHVGQQIRVLYFSHRRRSKDQTLNNLYPYDSLALHTHI